MSESNVRVRFAPSPTGYLHVGGARTALFNWLFARSRNGTFVLRIEDTDRERSSLESSREILAGLRWLGLDWDEGPEADGPFGPYFQSERKSRYKQLIETLLETGRAYHCFCTLGELEERRKLAIARGLPAQYDRRCRELPRPKVLRLLEEGKPASIRFAMQVESCSFVDLVHGTLDFGVEHLDDFIIQRADGLPTYNFAVVVDDALMRISHVIRGDDHLSNTPKQVELYRALGFEPPRFAHLPLILGPDGSRLSKRHGATSVAWYERSGYLPEAMVNYLALLGWSPGGDKELMEPDELVRLFSLERVSSKPAVFDMEKFNWMNAQYMKNLSGDRKADLVRRWAVNGNVEIPEWVERKLETIVEMFGERLKAASQFEGLAGYLLRDDFAYQDEAVEKHFSSPEVAERLDALAEALERLEVFSRESCEAALRALAKSLSLKAAGLIHPARVAVSGETRGPGIFELLEVLGRERVVERLRRAAGFVRKRFAADRGG